MTHLNAIAKQIREWQLARGLSDNELCKRFSGLGSTKTYTRILDGDVAELDLERWQIEYDQVWALIEIESQSTQDNEPIYDDLWHVTAPILAAKDAMAERGNNRLVIIEGPSGSGKTTAGRCLAARYGRRVVLTEADETWKDSLCSMLGGLLRSLSVRDIPLSTEDRKQKVLAILSGAPMCLVIDEAHHLGPRTLNLVKTILNQTQSQVIFLCIHTLFRKLECAAYEEARQLTQNRLAERVKLNGPALADVEKFLSRRLSFEPGTLKPCAKLCAGSAAEYGSWSFVNLVARKCRQLAGPAAVDQDTFVKALTKVQQSR